MIGELVFHWGVDVSLESCYFIGELVFHWGVEVSLGSWYVLGELMFHYKTYFSVISSWESFYGRHIFVFPPCWTCPLSDQQFSMGRLTCCDSSGRGCFVTVTFLGFIDFFSVGLITQNFVLIYVARVFVQARCREKFQN